MKIGKKSFEIESIDDISKTVRKALGGGQFVIELESDLLSGIVQRGGEQVASFKVTRA